MHGHVRARGSKDGAKDASSPHNDDLSPRRTFVAQGRAPSAIRADSLAHGAHTLSPGWGKRAERSRCRHPRVRDSSRVKTRFLLAGVAPGPDDQAHPRDRRARPRGQIAPRTHRCRPQRRNGFYDREPAARCAANLTSALCPTDSVLATNLTDPSMTFLSTDLSTAKTCDGGGAASKHPQFMGSNETDDECVLPGCGEL